VPGCSVRASNQILHALKARRSGPLPDGAAGPPLRARVMPHSKEYLERINSLEWRELRAQMIMLAGYRCERCGDSGSGLELHHLTYERLGYEHPDDLEVLCPICHGVADQEREVETAERVWNARVVGWTAKKYGEDRLEDYDFVEMEQELQHWLEERCEE
jgi:hypothetical protein